MGVAVRRYTDIVIIIITFPHSTCISSFWQQHPYLFVHLLNVFSFLSSIEPLKVLRMSYETLLNMPYDINIF